MGRSSRLLASILLATGVALVTLFSLTSCGTVNSPEPEPSFHYRSTAEGCSDFSVYKWNESMTEAIVVVASKPVLGLSTASRTFRLDSVPEAFLSVRVDRYTRTSLSPYCTDVLNPDQEAPRVWRAIAGTATITIDRDSIPPGETYKATVKLQNVRFTNGNIELTLSEETFTDVVVGWFPG
jgi:hypothetical protein